jgi:hypothetical protein
MALLKEMKERMESGAGTREREKRVKRLTDRKDSEMKHRRSLDNKIAANLGDNLQSLSHRAP